MSRVIHAIGCKGLMDPLVGAPLELLLAHIWAQVGIRFELVGGVDPHPLFDVEILQPALAAYERGEVIIFLGHSMGGMATFYMADELKRRGITSPLFIGLDATDWASNHPTVPPWSRAPVTQAGRWYAPSNIDKFMYFHQDAYPGGGRCYPAAGNTHTKLIVEHMPEQSHLSIVNAPLVRQMIVEALRALKKELGNG